MPGQRLQVVYPDVPDNYRTRARPAVADLHRRPRSTRSSGRRAPSARPSAEDLAAARADLRLEITRAFWALVTAREAEQVLGALARSHRRARRDLRARLDQGLIPPNERAVRRGAAVARSACCSIEARQRAAHRRSRSAAPDRASSGAGPIEPAAPLETAPVRHAGGRRCADREAIDAAAGAAGARRIAPSAARRASRRRAASARCRRSASAAASTTPGRTRASFRAPRDWEDSWDVVGQR